MISYVGYKKLKQNKFKICFYIDIILSFLQRFVL